MSRNSDGAVIDLRPSYQLMDPEKRDSTGFLNQTQWNIVHLYGNMYAQYGHMSLKRFRDSALLESGSLKGFRSEQLVRILAGERLKEEKPDREVDRRSGREARGLP